MRLEVHRLVELEIVVLVLLRGLLSRYHATQVAVYERWGQSYVSKGRHLRIESERLAYMWLHKEVLRALGVALKRRAMKLAHVLRWRWLSVLQKAHLLRRCRWCSFSTIESWRSHSTPVVSHLLSIHELGILGCLENCRRFTKILHLTRVSSSSVEVLRLSRIINWSLLCLCRCSHMPLHRRIGMHICIERQAMALQTTLIC